MKCGQMIILCLIIGVLAASALLIIWIITHVDATRINGFLRP
jgi:hypothetical protein